LDPQGKKMSKSKGNVIEPQDLIEKYGADALRFWAASSKLGEDLPFQEKDFVTGTRFLTKLWNASRFVLIHLKGYEPKKPKKLCEIDKWLLSKLNNLIKISTNSLEQYEYSKVKSETEKFFWHTFCDHYLEIVKDRLYNPNSYEEWEVESAKYTLYFSLLTILKLLAPILPHITEEIYSHYFSKTEGYKSIHISPWPNYEPTLKSNKAENIGDLAIDIIASIRKYKAENSLSVAHPLTLVIINSTKIKTLTREIQKTMKINEIKIGKPKNENVVTERFKISIEIIK
ncbi:MAG: class I tRNA ligase family protein, partial [Candidatus Aenigmatarchaeota archaeon]